MFFLTVGIFPAMVFSEEPEDWQFELAPFYLWAINIDGDMGLRGRAVNVNMDFGDIWNNLEWVYTLRFNTIYRNRFGVLFDYNYLDLGTEKSNELRNVDVGFKSQILNLGATYRFLNGLHTVDGVAGIRYTAMDVDLNFNNIGQRFDTDYNWVDPIIGLRYSYRLSDRWNLRLYGDIGGFGVGSDFTWQGVALIKFRAWENVILAGGYRALGVDYESNKANTFTYDAVTYGPLIGLDIRW